MALVAVFYNFGFFTILAYTPFLLGLSTHQLGVVYFGWGLLVALTSVFAAQRLERRFGLVLVLAVALGGVALDLLAGGILHDSVGGLVAVVVISGALLGVVNTVLTEAVMAVAVVERPVASSAYSFVRFTGGAIAPFVAGNLGEHVSAPAPMYLGAGMVALSVVTLVVSRHHLRREAQVEREERAAVVPAGVILVAVDGTPAARHVVETAGRVARSRDAAVHVVHVRETRSVGEGTAELESRRAGRALVEAAVGRLGRLGVAGATGEVLNVTGHHADAAAAVVHLADRVEAGAIVAGRPDRHGGELGARSMTAQLTERAPCDVIVVVPEAARVAGVAALA